MDYPATLLDLSSVGAGLAIDVPVKMHRGLACEMTIYAEGLALPLDARTARISVGSDNTQVGLDLAENTYARRRSWIQILEPIAMGSLLKPAADRLSDDSEAGIATSRFLSTASSSLTVWRHESDQLINGFELFIQNYYIRSGATPPELKFYTEDTQDDAKKSNFGHPTLRLSSEANAELRRLYNWIALHLSKDLPEDVVSFMQRYQTELGADEGGIGKAK